MQDELPPHSVNSIKVADKEVSGIISRPGPSHYLQRNWKTHLCIYLKKKPKKTEKAEIKKLGEFKTKSNWKQVGFTLNNEVAVASFSNMK